MGFGDILSGVGSALGGLGGLATGIYNIVNNEDQKSYERRLQEKMFEREDNATQRKVEDLKKAGLNPILASGQGASAGASVSTGNNHQVASPDTSSFMNFATLEQMKLQNKGMDIANTTAMGSPEYLAGLAIKKGLSKKDWKDTLEDTFSKGKDGLVNTNRKVVDMLQDYYETGRDYVYDKLYNYQWKKRYNDLDVKSRFYND